MIKIPSRFKDKIEIAICATCSKRFIRRKVKKGNGNSGRLFSVGSVRRIHSKTCSGPCAKEYGRKLQK